MTDSEKLDFILQRMTTMDNRLDSIENSVTDVKLSLENETNKNIQLLAENHSNLIDKLNQSIKVSDKTNLYEIQVNILKSKVEQLEKDVEEIKEQLATA